MEELTVTMNSNTTIGRAEIEALRDEAASAGDEAMVRLCDAALDETEDTSQQAAWWACERAIDAQAMADAS